MTLNEQLPVPREPKAPRKRTISRRVKNACDLLISGECKTITAAAKRVGLSRTHLSRTLREPHVQVFWTGKAVETIRVAAPIAAARLVELMHGASEHVAFDASKHILGIEGIQPAERPISQVNVAGDYYQPGYQIVIQRREDRDRPTQIEQVGDGPVFKAVPVEACDTQSPANEPLTIEHQGEGEEGDDPR